MSTLSTRIVRFSAAVLLSLAALAGFGHFVDRSMDKLAVAIGPVLEAQTPATVKLSGLEGSGQHG
ncbi:hypothetical protein [Chitinimonas lacunae]|uniref:Uncharacterized protein n=1 Tax=Chitinimonas lacunae TaxID=1963018 RepID=A0ABV8MTM4_9NEIS